MRGSLSFLIGLFCVLSASTAQASKLIAILPLDVSNAEGKMTKAARVSLEEMLRDTATNALTPAGWTVLTGETTLQVLRDNGVKPEECGNQECHLTSARELKVEKFVTGTVQFVDGQFTASMRLIDTSTGRIVSSQRVMGKTVTELSTAFEAKASEFFGRGEVVTAASSKPAATTTASTSTRPASTSSSVFTAGDLQWMNVPKLPELAWDYAKVYCERLPLDGGGWRLPTKDELVSLFMESTLNPELKNFPGMNTRIWSSTSAKSDSSMVTVDMSKGDVSEGYKTTNWWVRCVR